MPAELSFRAMGSDAHVTVVGPSGTRARARVEYARDRIIALEERWSRFLPTSELSHVNAHAGEPTVVSLETFLLLTRAVEGWWLTGGRFDPTVLPALERAGYDRSFDSGLDELRVADGEAEPTIGCQGIVFDPEASTVRLPPGAAVDPGGIGKGLAADLVTEELLSAGCRGACVNLGGDLRAEGEGPGGGGWVVGLVHPMFPMELARLHLRAGAVASTSRIRRAWKSGEERRHHLIDPVSGRPAWPGLAGVSVINGQAWRAEVLAKACFLAGPSEGDEVLLEHGAAGLLVDDQGASIHVGEIKAFLA